jgi:branched-chain amino acid transport system permease protein
MLGAYGTFLLFVSIGMNYWVAVVLSSIAVGLCGIILERVFFRPFQQQMERVLIVAFGLILVLQNAAVIIFGGEAKAIPSPFRSIIKILNVSLSLERLVVIIVGVILVSALILFIDKTMLGQAMVAISQDSEVAALQGINTGRVSSIAMFLGSFTAAVAGALMGTMFGLNPTMGTFALMKGIAVIILGGLGSIPGTIIAGLIIGLIDGLVPPLVSAPAASLVGFILIINILLFRPQGIMGHE